MYHLILVRKENDARKKEYVRRELIQSFSPVDYRSMRDTGAFTAYDEVEILHDPLLTVDNAPAEKEAAQAPSAMDAVVNDPADSRIKEILTSLASFSEADLRKEYKISFGTKAPAEMTSDEVSNAIASWIYGKEQEAK